MAKLKLELAHREIIMKKIITITIDGVEFYKSKYEKNARVLQLFYFFIIRNKNEISYITYKDHSYDEYVNHLHLKAGKLHCEYECAFYRTVNQLNIDLDESYYLGGEKISSFEWKKKIRKIKIKNIQFF